MCARLQDIKAQYPDLQTDGSGLMAFTGSNAGANADCGDCCNRSTTCAAHFDRVGGVCAPSTVCPSGGDHNDGCKPPYGCNMRGAQCENALYNNQFAAQCVWCAECTDQAVKDMVAQACVTDVNNCTQYTCPNK